MSKLDKLDELEKGATGGPWRWTFAAPAWILFSKSYRDPEHTWVLDGKHGGQDCNVEVRYRDREFIAHLRNNARALIEVAKIAKELCPELIGLLEDGEDRPDLQQYTNDIYDLGGALSRLEAGHVEKD